MVSLIMTSNASNKNLTTSPLQSSSVLSLLVISNLLMYIRQDIFIQSFQLKTQKKKKTFLIFSKIILDLTIHFLSKCIYFKIFNKKKFFIYFLFF